jgi:hypothetical protein
MTDIPTHGNISGDKLTRQERKFIQMFRESRVSREIRKIGWACDRCEEVGEAVKSPRVRRPDHWAVIRFTERLEGGMANDVTENVELCPACVQAFKDFMDWEDE